jgi:hypothetical protein
MDDKSFNIRVPKKWARVGMIAVVTAMIVAPVTAWAAHTFNDVPNTNTFHEDIAWLEASGVTKGCNPPANTLFCPKDEVTREQMSAFMRRFAQYLGAEDGTPAQADNAATADNASNADELAGQSAASYRSIVAVDAHHTYTDPLGPLSPGSYELAAVDITVPASGVILVNGVSTWESTGADSNVVAWLEMDTSTPCDDFFDGDILPASFSEVWVDGADLFGSGTTPSVAAVSVGSSGTHSLHSCATVQAGSISGIERTITARQAWVTERGGPWIHGPPST